MDVAKIYEMIIICQMVVFCSDWHVIRTPKMLCILDSEVKCKNAAVIVLLTLHNEIASYIGEVI